MTRRTKRSGGRLGKRRERRREERQKETDDEDDVNDYGDDTDNDDSYAEGDKHNCDAQHFQETLRVALWPCRDSAPFLGI
jgi:hypothetical protein